MNTGAHDAGGGFTQSVGTNASRGVAVILAAVAVGALLMWLGYSDGAAEAGGETPIEATGDPNSDDGTAADGTADGSTDGVAAPDSTTTSSTTTTTAAPIATARPAAEVKVIVLNGADRKPGIAGRGTKIVDAAGFTTLEASDAVRDQATEIQYTEGFEADAVAVAEAFGLDASVVTPVPATLNAKDSSNATDADVIVIVGNDNKIDI